MARSDSDNLAMISALDIYIPSFINPISRPLDDVQWRKRVANTFLPSEGFRQFRRYFFNLPNFFLKSHARGFLLSPPFQTSFMQFDTPGGPLIVLRPDHAVNALVNFF